MSFDKVIQMLIFDGNPNGRIMCELSGWDGLVYKISRSDLSEFSNRSNAESTGVYFLIGRSENGENTVYIGEAEKMLTRLKQHLKDSVYWSDCIVVISKNNWLNKAHVKYLENKFYILAKDAKRAIITNSTVPTCSSISEYDEATLKEFISNTRLLVNALGYKIFESFEDVSTKSQSNQTKYYIDAPRGANATGVVVSDGFAVLKGSKIATSTVPSISPNLARLRDSLLLKGVIDNSFTFTDNYIFTSPSLAAATVLGRNANGRTEWKTQDKKTLKSIEEDSVTT